MEWGKVVSREQGSGEGVDDLLYRTKREEIVILFRIKRDLGGIYKKGC